MKDWAEIRRSHRSEGLSVKAIVRRTGVSRNAVRRALTSDLPPKYVRQPAGRAFDAFELAVRGLLQSDPRMPSSVIAERIGWAHSGRLLRAHVHVLRPLFLPPDPASRTVYLPGEVAQCDLWFPPVDIPVGAGQSARLPVLVMVCGYSRVMQAIMLPSRQAADLLTGHWELLQRLGAVPRVLVWDNEAAVGSWNTGRPRLSSAFAGFAGTLGIKILLCRPGDPEAKGLVERGNGYLETSFLPGRAFTGPDDFNAQLGAWVGQRANQRHHRGLGCRPDQRWAADSARMLSLPPVAPLTGWSATTRLSRNYYVRLAGNDYSVHPSVIGRQVCLSADLDTVRVRCGQELVAQHPRCWARHQSITDPAHRAAADKLRAHHHAITASRGRPGPVTDAAVVDRSLGEYDTVLFGPGAGSGGQVA